MLLEEGTYRGTGIPLKFDRTPGAARTVPPELVDRFQGGELEVVQGAMTTFLGMEYPGVVLIEQELYENNGRGLETTVAHEVAHQWWYSLVGNDA